MSDKEMNKIKNAVLKNGHRSSDKSKSYRKKAAKRSNESAPLVCAKASPKKGKSGVETKNEGIETRRLLQKYLKPVEERKSESIERLRQDISRVEGISHEEVEKLKKAGIESVDMLVSADDSKLVELGIEDARVKKLKQNAEKLLKDLEKKKEKIAEMKKKQDFEKRMDIARKYATKLVRTFKNKVKAVVVYGSTAKGTHHEKSDLDIFVIMDDTGIGEEIPESVKDRIWDDLVRIAKDTDKRITIQAFMFLTEFWENLKVAEPVLISILRYGIPVYDVGIFMPAKRMVERGKVPTTREAVDKKIYSAPKFVDYAVSRIKSAAHYLEQAVASAGNAALMMVGRLPVNKEEVADALDSVFVERGMLEKEVPDRIREIVKFAKEVEYLKEEDVSDLGGRTDKYIAMARDVIKRLKELIDSMDVKKKGNVLIETYKMFLKADVVALRKIGIEPPEELDDLPKVMQKMFPELKEKHSYLFETMIKYLNMVKEGKEDEIPEEVIYELREKTKEFIEALDDLLKRRMRKK